MATVEIELRKYKKYRTEDVGGIKMKVELKDAPMPLVLRITSGSDVKRRNTGLYIPQVDWDKNKRRVKSKHPEAARLNAALDKLVKEAEGVKADAITERQVVSASDIMDAVFVSNDFYALALARQKEFEEQNKYNTAKNYASMVSRLKEYSPSLTVEQVTPKFLEGFRTFLLTPKTPNAKPAKHNTIVAHLSKIAAVLNNSGLKISNPFSEVTRGTYKRGQSEELYMEDIEKMKQYVPNGEWEAIAKDTFLFSFYAAGMSSKDILLMEWSEIKRGRIDFGRRKVEETSGMHLSIPLNAVTKSILEKYDKSTKTVFNLVTMYGNDKASCKEREKIQASINKALKRIALNSGIGKSIKFKDARTAFAQIANYASQRNVYGIQQAMGHTKISTTEIYLGSDNRAVDELLQAVYAIE